MLIQDTIKKGDASTCNYANAHLTHMHYVQHSCAYLRCPRGTIQQGSLVFHVRDILLSSSINYAETTTKNTKSASTHEALEWGLTSLETTTSGSDIAKCVCNVHEPVSQEILQIYCSSFSTPLTLRCTYATDSSS